LGQYGWELINVCRNAKKTRTKDLPRPLAISINQIALSYFVVHWVRMGLKVQHNGCKCLQDVLIKKAQSMLDENKSRAIVVSIFPSPSSF
jgi:hypothetical protein